jgi:hypothetical protein
VIVEKGETMEKSKWRTLKGNGIKCPVCRDTGEVAVFYEAKIDEFKVTGLQLSSCPFHKCEKQDEKGIVT